MKSKPLKIRRALVIAFMLFSIAALGVSDNTVCALGFCEGCTQQCADEAEGIYLDCMHQTTKPMSECARERDDYKARCNSLFCTGCPINN